MDVFGEIRGQSTGESGGRRLPSLPILNPNEVPAPAAAPPARGQREKYGSLFYLGVGGLVVLVGLIGWFAHGLWANRDIWSDVYTLSDPRRDDPERVEAALRLAGNPRFDDPARLGLALRKDLPSMARYLLAESISTDLVAHDPRAYAFTVARSEGWPDWLRLLLARRLAYGAGHHYAIPRPALEELRRHPDPMIALWSTYAMTVLPRGGPDPALAAALEESTHRPAPFGELATMLDAAKRAKGKARDRQLDEATNWLRRHHPLAAEVWHGWEIRGDRVVREAGR